jgi:hypothetical protein
MGTVVKGTVHGRTVELHHQVERLDGQRVLVLLEPLVESELRAGESAQAWREWIADGPDAPIEDEDPSFP